MAKPGAALALTLLASELDGLDAWLLDRCDYDVDDAGNKLGNAEARHWSTVQYVRAELARLAKEVEAK